MLPKKQRLHTMRDFRHLHKRGRAVSNKFLILKSVKTKPEDPLRLAFVISNKTEKTAVKRNRAKRQLREIVRHLLPELKEGFDVAITIKKPFVELKTGQQKEAARDILKKARLFAR